MLPSYFAALVAEKVMMSYSFSLQVRVRDRRRRHVDFDFAYREPPTMMRRFDAILMPPFHSRRETAPAGRREKHIIHSRTRYFLDNKILRTCRDEESFVPGARV